MYYNLISMLSIIKNGNVSKASILSHFYTCTNNSIFKLQNPRSSEGLFINVFSIPILYTSSTINKIYNASCLTLLSLLQSVKIETQLVANFLYVYSGFPEVGRAQRVLPYFVNFFEFSHQSRCLPCCTTLHVRPCHWKKKLSLISVFQL